MPGTKNSSVTTRGVLIVLAVVLAAGAVVLFVVRADPFGTSGPGLSGEFLPEEHVREIPPDVPRYREVLAIRTGLGEALALAAGPGDRICVAGDRKVVAFAPDGRPLGTVIADLPEAPRCLAMAGDGRLYVGLAAGLAVYSPDGAPEKRLPSPRDGAKVNSVVLHEQGIFVALHHTSRAGFVAHYSTDGELLDVIELKDVNLLNRLLDVAVVPGGLRVTDAGAAKGRIRVYGFDGRLESAWGDLDTTGDLAKLSGCCNPVHLAALPGGRLVTAEKGEQALVKVYASDTGEARGRVEAVVADLRGAKGLDVAIDSRQRVLVLDSRTGIVHVYEPPTE